ncbi:UDP:flavonoid glycosyltransferase YjiC, YdhE family [Amycolatopsis pretoriensis]|uniref:UDP:flavonoid glycosyltransferase YjiC, YdhE family n=1 Tax=Amycolatopsis pretoriensis TaxID=218821 RepID=A0A1H5QNG9_9PSEU|nr:UDP:flavonoid glycosyltransferase YjiC, YdhE family [Amycolatopsis pretoriensis]
MSFREDLQSKEPEFIGDPLIAESMIKGESAALSALRPDVVLHGFWPPASIASRMLGIPTICFLSLPMHPDTLMSRNFLRDIPDPAKLLTYLPRPVRRRLAALIPRRAIAAVPMFAQRNIRVGAERAGWEGVPLQHIWDMLSADLTIVNDLPDFYEDVRLPLGFRLTGPLFASAAGDEEIELGIAALFGPRERRPKVLCTMGSSAKPEQLLAAVAALTGGVARDWNSVIVVPPAICPLELVRRHVGDAEHVYLTDRFVPAPLVNELADVVVSHGGQGTVQTAVSTGTPVVGFGVQTEQQLNLDRVVEAGAGIRLPIHRWKPAAIRRAVNKVLTEPAYEERARLLQRRFAAVDGRTAAGREIWHWLVDEDRTASRHVRQAMHKGAGTSKPKGSLGAVLDGT